MTIELLDERFDPHARLAAYYADAAFAGRNGAEASFIGYMRDNNEGEQVTGMHLEYYPGMTEKHLHCRSGHATVEPYGCTHRAPRR